MQQSVKLDFDLFSIGPGLASGGTAPDRVLSCIRALELRLRLAQVLKVMMKEYILERIDTRLPFATKLYTHLHTSVDLFRATLIVDTKLENVTVLDRIGTRFCVGR